MDIENYQERPAVILRREGDWLRAFVGDTPAGIGEALEVRGENGQAVYAVVRRHAGGREVDAMLLDPPAWVQAGCTVHPTGEAAHIPRPRGGLTKFSTLAISPARKDPAKTFAFRGRALDFAELNGTRPTLPTDLSPIDHLAPVAGHGLNLVLDASPSAAAFERLCQRIAQAGPFDARLHLAKTDSPADWATHALQLDADTPRQLAGLRVLTHWAAHLRDQGQNLLICAELPPLTSPGYTPPEDAALGTSIGEVIDLLGTTLSSTHTATITALIRLPLFESAAGIDAIIETMSLGEVDAQIFIDADARFEPTRSTSRAQLSADAQRQQQQLLGLLSRAARARDKAALWGEFGVEEAELEAINAAEALRVQM